MSAYVVDTAHIDALVTAGLAWNVGSSRLAWYWPELDGTEGHAEREAKRFELDHETAGRVAVMLYAENFTSVLYRYSDCTTDNVPGPIDCLTPDGYVFARLMGTPDPVVILSALACYEYQSCEHPGWATSEAHAFCEALRYSAIHHLPGMREAPWEITDRLIFSPYRRVTT